ncbi:hypothetical protein HELRODRAFT_166830 [Helobdella robusta]|uniref:Uncharacterized protein n=1 Tax=Helobdella robusta TaxID=6412 RepID=T1EYL3_HELRO|nr:hypothetical protein HELRODRAFT_166830 [Helobdella robusta]ESO11787.1 hypothetical protein HELRODRAFT_166830 [Helobdella robusta]
MNAEKLQKSEPMEIPSFVRNYTNEYRIQQRTLGPQIAQQKQRGGFVFTESKACFHWACQSVGRLSHNPGLFSLGRRVWSAFAQPRACFHWACQSVGRLSHNPGLFSLGRRVWRANKADKPAQNESTRPSAEDQRGVPNLNDVVGEIITLELDETDVQALIRELGDIPTFEFF